MRIHVVARTDVGRMRTGNEDAFLVGEPGATEGVGVPIFAVADGMGGHQAGEVASATAIAALVEGVAQGSALADAIAVANTAVFTEASTDLALRGMGTTMTAAVPHDDAVLIGHVGDSRAYLLRDGELRQLTTDHSVVAELIAAGEITEAEAEVDPRRAMITRALGIDADVDVDVVEVTLAPGDRLLLCSDGLTAMVRDDDIAEILRGERARDAAADALVAAANAAGGADNITVVLAEAVAELTDAPADEPDPASAAPPDPGDDPTEQVPAVVDPGAATPPEGVPVVAAESPEPKRRWWRRGPS